MNWLDKIPLPMLIMISLMLGLAPFVPEPHVIEKLKIRWKLIQTYRYI